MQPDFPIISIYDNEVIELLNDEKILKRGNALGLLIKSDKILFDNSGVKWTYTLLTNRKIIDNNLFRLIYKWFYNPVFTGDINWIKIGRYDIDELKNSIKLCIDKDDDILTQFLDSVTLKTKIENCGSFENIWQTIDKYVYNVDEEAIFNENE
jgi:hypothetical protein